MVDDFLSEVDAKLSTDATMFKAKRLNGFLHPPNINARRYYELEGYTSPSILGLTVAVSSITKGHYLSLVARTDVTPMTSETEDFEASSKSMLEVMSWLDWWLITIQGLVNYIKFNNMVKVHF